MKKFKTMDGNTAAAYISYAFTEVAAIYPITPSSPMAEVVDEWATNGLKNIFDQTVDVIELQSEAGAAGAVHGSIRAGALTTTYTASQGLLLMIPNMFKIAGELLPAVFHVAARSVAAAALNIYGDHSDVMAARQTGFCMLAESSVQEVMDLSAVAHLSALEGSLPFVNFFDGFRTSHELQKIEVIDYEDLKKMVNYKAIEKFRNRAMNPNHPHVSGSAQNPDIFFQQRETVNPYYLAMPAIVEKYMKKINEVRGTDYDLTNYFGAPDAEQVIIAIGSVAPVAIQAVKYLNEKGRKVGFLNIHMYRPFPKENLLAKLPKTVKSIAVLDRTKEPGSDGEPLLLDVQSVLFESDIRPIIIGGRYGLGSKDVTPDQIINVFDHLTLPREEMKARFTVGINDDVAHTSLPMTKPLDLTAPNTFQAKFWGFGSDGTVGANKQAIKIIGDNTDMYAQAYFAYDAKKSGGLTVSHLRFGHEPIDSTYLVEKSDYIGCHNASYIHKYNLLKGLRDGGTFVLNTTWTKEEVLEHLPAQLKRYIGEHDIKFYIINAVDVAQKDGLGRRINMVMSTTFFELTDIMDHPTYLPLLKAEVDKTYGKKSREIVEKNWKAIDDTFESLQQIDVPADWATIEVPAPKPDKNRPDYVKNIVDVCERQEGDSLSVKDLVDNGLEGGDMPSGTAAYEKRGVALEVPRWIPENCIQCNTCSFTCPHASIRPILADEEELKNAPEGYITRDLKGADGMKFRIQVSVEDCTGCGLCVQACPAREKAIVMTPYEEQKDEAINWAFAMTLKEKANPFKKLSVKGSQFEKPLMEFSGACAGCGETPYVKLMTQLYGDRMMIANATGCSSIWGASAPVTPYTTKADGTGPAWSNSLFEDNAEYGFGMHLASKARRKELLSLVNKAVAAGKGSAELQALMTDWAEHMDEGEGTQQRAAKLKAALADEAKGDDQLETILSRSDLFVKPSQWIFGGDGWAYDIGFGGVDHVLASGEDVNIFVMDNELYANTGGQMSKATQHAAVAKFAAGGKKTQKKDLGMMAVTYGNVYVASISIEANPVQAIKAINEAENYPGPSLIIGYVPCINHGLRGGLVNSLKESKQAVESGYWPLYRFNPLLTKKGKDPMVVDFKKVDFSKMKDFMMTQTRYSSLQRVKKDPEVVQEMFDGTVSDAEYREGVYKRMADYKK